MKQQIKITIILSVVLIITLAVKYIYFHELSTQAAYFFYTVLWTCGVLIVIFVLSILWYLRYNRMAGHDNQDTMVWPNRRKTYRIIYPNYKRPKLLIEKADSQAKRQLEFPVLDLSQNGLCFIDDGSLGDIHSLKGQIQFQNGEIVRVEGTVLRNQKNQVSVQLQTAIDWSIILHEQRHLLSDTKPVH